MAEEDDKSIAQPPLYPERAFPVTFVDGVASIGSGPGIVKFYFYRTDPNIHGSGGANTIPIRQIVMPMAGFVETAVFFAQYLEKLAADGTVSQAQIDEVRKGLSK